MHTRWLVNSVISTWSVIELWTKWMTHCLEPYISCLLTMKNFSVCSFLYLLSVSVCSTQYYTMSKKSKQNCFCQVESECISYNFGPFAIFVPKIIRFDWNLTKLWQKQFCLDFFETQCTLGSLQIFTSDAGERDQSTNLFINWRLHSTMYVSWQVSPPWCTILSDRPLHSGISVLALSMLVLALCSDNSALSTSRYGSCTV